MSEKQQPAQSPPNTNMLDRDKVGAAAWTYAHAVAQTYPWYPSSEEVEKYRSFFRLFGELFTCKVCAGNWMKKLKAHPMTDDVMRDRESLNIWLIDRHNEINMQNNKKLHSFDSVSESHWGTRWKDIFQLQKQQEGRQKPKSWRRRTSDEWSERDDGTSTIFGIRADIVIVVLFLLALILLIKHLLS